jgi:hypothetical protein
LEHRAIFSVRYLVYKEMIMSKSPEQLDALLRFVIGIVFSLTVFGMVILSLYSVIFVTQPMNAIAPADKNFFYLLNDMSKYILGSLATLLAIKGKDVLSDKTPPPVDEPTEEKKDDSNSRPA